MNDTSRQLVTAARDALAALPTDRTSVEEDAKVAVIAVLRQLRVMMNGDELDALGDDDDADEGWPDADDLFLLANDIEASL